MIVDTLDELDSWYNEASQGSNRPKLLSKLALLELCGWLEGQFDQVLMMLQAECLSDSAWVEVQLINRTHGFLYAKHFRPMVARVIGEYHTRYLELELEVDHPGELEQLTSYTNELWVTRGSFAHAELNNNIATQQKFYAPSWVKNRYRVINKILRHYEAKAVALAQQIKH